MKNILVNAGLDEHMDGRLQVALDFAHRFDAHLIFVQAQPYQSIMGVDMFGGAHLIAEALAPAIAAWPKCAAGQRQSCKRKG